MQEHTTMRIWKQTQKNLRMLHALTGEPIVVIIDRLVSEKLRQEQAQYNATTAVSEVTRNAE